MEFFIDIETVPCQDEGAFNEILAQYEAQAQDEIAQLKPPANYKSDEAINKWTNEVLPVRIASINDAIKKLAMDEYKKQSFDGAVGQVAMIGYATDTLDVSVIDAADKWATNEAFILASLADVLPKICGNIEFIGQNVRRFDLRFLVQRYLVNGLVVPAPLVKAANSKDWDNLVHDTMFMFAGQGERIKLEKICKALGVQSPKGDMDGSKVYETLLAGDYQKVVEYCAGDVEAMRQCYRKMRSLGI